ncbi:hypothetical protein TNCV_2483901 [Trichonephila clavipes]|uniref:Uncharacterized protein n=1 Tax=Trichonephila clavipes TaxID=2585209 RepID=A0A8X6VZE2_TRICX|nr:hypothetical protein TNCV_2483901 [Trichonephila clavipes]
MAPEVASLLHLANERTLSSTSLTCSPGLRCVNMNVALFSYTRVFGVFSNHGQVTWTTPELTLPSPNYHITPTG